MSANINDYVAVHRAGGNTVGNKPISVPVYGTVIAKNDNVYTIRWNNEPLNRQHLFYYEQVRNKAINVRTGRVIEGNYMAIVIPV